MGSWAIIILLLFAGVSFADGLADSVNRIETEWANIHYGLPKDQQADAYQPLLAKTENLAKRYPGRAEAIYWQAVIKANLAEYESAVTALDSIYEVRRLLNQAIAIRPDVMDGSAYVVLGSLYYLTPAWPIAFGDNDKAEEFLKKALAINPNGIDGNYFYGDFLLSQDKFKEAEMYFNKALSAPVRPEQAYGDNQLKKLAQSGLAKAKGHQNAHKS